jgi:hypothetical protein
MKNADKILVYLRENRHTYCDDCISQRQSKHFVFVCHFQWGYSGIKSKDIKMKKMIILFGMAFLAMPLFCEVVNSDVLTSKYGVSYAERQKSNFIEKNGYSFRYLGNGTWDVKNISQNRTGSSVDNDKTIIIVVVSIIHIILTFCVYKMKGPYFACFYFFLAPLALAGLLLFATKGMGSLNSDKNHITITHKRQ